MSVDTKRLRELLATHRDAVAAEAAIVDAVVDYAGMTADEFDAHIAANTTAAAAVAAASGAFARAVHRDLPALLDEADAGRAARLRELRAEMDLAAARALLSEVRDHGLASFDPAQRRIDLTRRVVAFLEP